MIREYEHPASGQSFDFTVIYKHIFLPFGKHLLGKKAPKDTSNKTQKTQYTFEQDL